MNKSILLEAARRFPSEIMHPYEAVIGLEGLDAICAFAEPLHGLTVYVPSLKRIFGGCLEAAVKADFKNGNYLALSRRYGLTERHVRRVLGQP